jgi:Arc/MetJ-type ribon-helix-helix transcriptional regulator
MTSKETSMPSPDIRINARLTGADASRLQELLQRNGGSVSDVLRDALREFHASHVRPQRDPMQLLAGYIGTGEGPEDLSSNYKQYLTEALESKLPLRVHDQVNSP